MHQPRRFLHKRLFSPGVEAQLTQEQRERLLGSVEVDVEALLLDVDAAEREIQRALESVDLVSDADLIVLADLEEALDGTIELKRWCRAKRAEIAELLP
jgi:hypothetical protein